MADTAASEAGTANTDAATTQSTTALTGTADTTATTQTADAKATPTNDATATDAAKSEAEITYEFKAPEGVELDKVQVDQFTAVAKELKLPPEKAQTLVDIAAKAEVARREAFAAQVKAWGDEVAADKALASPENQAAMRGVVDKFGSDDLKGLLNSTGLGNHPALVRFVANVTKALSEDQVHGKAAGAAAPLDAATLLYGNTNKA